MGTQSYSLIVTDATGIVNYCASSLGYVGNYVWNDTNGNGVKDEAVSVSTA